MNWSQFAKMRIHDPVMAIHGHNTFDPLLKLSDYGDWQWKITWVSDTTTISSGGNPSKTTTNYYF